MGALADIQIKLVDSMDEANECKRWLSTRSHISLDTETTGLSPQHDNVRLVQIGDADNAWVIPVERIGWGGLAVELLNRYQGTYSLHNAPFDDVMIFNSIGVRLPRHRMRDTRLMSHVLTSTGSLGLKKISETLIDPHAANAQHELNECMTKNNWNWTTVPTTLPQYWGYAGLDVILTSRVDEILWPRTGLTAPRSYELEYAAQWVTQAMELRGAMIDRGYIRQFQDELTYEYDEATTFCNDIYGVNASSSDAVIAGLLREGVQLVKRTTSGAKFSLDKEVLNSINHPLAQAVLTRRQAQHIDGYLKSYLSLAGSDDIIHPSINSVGGTAKNNFEPGGDAGVRTGRMSGSNPNLQNVPVRTKEGKRIRRAFIPRPGNTWVKSDAEQIEMRILAHMSNEPAMIEAFHRKDDFFVSLARKLFNEPDFQKSDPRRQFVKNAGYALSYGAGNEQFARTAKCTVEEATEFMNAFAKTFPAATKFTKSIVDLGFKRHRSESEGYVSSPITGRKHTADRFRMYALVNYLIQGTAAEIMKLKLVEASNAGLDEFMVFPVHDEVDLDVPTHLLPDVLDTLDKSLTDYDMLKVPIKWSVGTGPSWGECQ